MNSIGFDTMHGCETAVSAFAFEKLIAMPHVHVLGAARAEDHNGILTFTLDDVHPHDVGQFIDAQGIAIRVGHHCAQPVHRHFGVYASNRASSGIYNSVEDAQALIEALGKVRPFFGVE